jgi:hypothetical protein
MDGVRHPSQFGRTGRVAGFVGGFDDLETPAGVLRHFRHERRRFERAVFIEGRHDFGERPNFDPIADSWPRCAGHGSPKRLRRVPAGRPAIQAYPNTSRSAPSAHAYPALARGRFDAVRLGNGKAAAWSA